MSSTPIVGSGYPARESGAAQFAAVGVATAAVLAVAFPSLYYPFGRDQGIHAYIAQLAGDGYVVYRDVFNVKPPMTTVVHGLSQVLFGENMQAIRIMDLLLVAAASIMLLELVRSHSRSIWIGAVAAVAFATAHYSTNYWSTAQTDGWCNVFIVASVLAYSRSLAAGSGRWRLFLLCGAGFLMGLSFWLKYTTAVVLLAYPAAHLAYRMPLRRILSDGAAVTAGFLSCIGIGIAVLAAMGALQPFLDIQDFMRSYVAHSPSWWRSLIAPVRILSGPKAVTVLAALGACAAVGALFRPPHRGWAVGLAVWAVAGWGSAALQGKIFLYHLLPMFPPLAIAAALGVYAAVAALRAFDWKRAEAPAALAACALILWFSPMPGQYRALASVLSGEQTLRAYWDGGGFGYRDFQTRDNLALVDDLEARTLPCDSLFIWGYEPYVYFLSGRKLVSRFVYNFPMFTAFYRQSYRDELMAALTADPPVAFVVEHEDRTPHVSVHNHDSAEVLQQFTALKEFVDSRYRLQGKVGRFDVYLRGDIDPAAPRSCPR